MRKSIIALLMAATAPFAATLAVASEFIVYPAEGQSADQQRQDQAECQIWATDSTGVDPVALANRQAPAQQQVGGERVGGGLRGAAGGAIIGAIAGDAGKGAAIGGAVGVMRGGAAQRHRQASNEAAVQSDEAARQEQMATFNRAYKACMEGRGYSLQ